MTALEGEVSAIREALGVREILVEGRHHDALSSDLLGPREAVDGVLFQLPLRERIFIERMTSDRKLKASREGSK